MMSEKLLAVTVTGKQHSWSFHTYADPKYIQEWLDDGLEVEEVINVVPTRVVNLGALRIFVFLQNLLHMNWRK